MSPRPAVAFSPYAAYGRDEWARLRADTPMPLNEAELENLSGLTERVSTREVVEIYLPLSRLLNLYVEASQGLHGLTTRFLRKGDGKMPFIVGLAGSVAAGKSTTARVLQALLARWPSHPRVDLVPTDDELYAHYKKVSDAISLPIMVYNNPATANVDMMPELIARLAEIPNCLYVKESTLDPTRKQHHALVGRRITEQRQRTGEPAARRFDHRLELAEGDGARTRTALSPEPDGTRVTIEAVATGCPGVVECACIGVSDAKTGEAVKLFVVKAPGAEPTKDEILKLHPLATYVGGRKVYEAPEANGAF